MAKRLIERVKEWVAQDPDPRTRAELNELLGRAGQDDAAYAELADRFAGKLEFGTAGLRGRLGAGPRRMNRLTVRRTTAGLAWWLGPEKTVVVGYDARHHSADFAVDAGCILSGAEITAVLLPRPLPTPVLAYAVRALRADAGVMITASHNPPQDNGYKVFVGGGGPEAGSQITSSQEAAISAAIDAVDAVDELPLGNSKLAGERLVRAYLSAIIELPLAEEREVSVAYTPLHGVGGATLTHAFARAGLPEPYVVPEQAQPDADFPTVAFPNPEEPGAMDMVNAAAEAQGSDLILAHDPDADRLAVGVPGYGRLTGDEVGGLLAEHVLRRTSGPGRVVATTVVSSGLLRRIAAEHGVRFQETLTGFKWLARAGRRGERNVFCYEEALGYSIGSERGRPVADKDGIGAALVIATMAAQAKAEGRTLVDLLDEQARTHGLHRTAQVSLRLEKRGALGEAMRALRASPPAELGEFTVESSEDFARGVGGLPPADMLRYHLSGPVQARLVVRPSGTEPKLKAYVEVVSDAGEDVAAAREEADAHLAGLKHAIADVLLDPATA